MNSEHSLRSCEQVMYKKDFAASIMLIRVRSGGFIYKSNVKVLARKRFHDTLISILHFSSYCFIFVLEQMFSFLIPYMPK